MRDKGRRLPPLRRLLAAASLSLVAVLLTGRSPAEEPAPKRIPLKVLYGRYLSFAPLAIAKAEGFFSTQGLDVELVHTSGNNEASSALLKGEIDVAAGMLRPAEFNAIARGAEIRLVADKGHYGPGPCMSSAIVARPGFVAAKDAESPEHLRHARASTTPLSFAEYVLETFVNGKGLRLTDLDLMRIPEPAAEAAVEKGSLDFLHMAEPYLTRALRTGRVVVWKPVREILPDAQLAVITYGPSLLRKDRDAGRRFMVAYLQGVRRYNLGKIPRNVELIAKETGQDPELLRSACWETIGGDGRINVESVLAYQRWAVRRGLLDAVLPTERFWDPSFVDAANGTLGPPSP